MKSFPWTQRPFFRWTLAALLAPVAALGSSHPVQAQANLGMNIFGLSDSEPDRKFANVFDTSSRFTKIGTPLGGSDCPVDSNGWPTQDFVAFLWDGSFAKNTTGTYALSFTGQADVAGATNKSYNSSTNTTTATLTYTSDASQWITFTNTRRTSSSALNTGLTNLKLMRPTTVGGTTTYSTSTRFTTPFKDSLKRYRALRFMDFTATNANQVSNWADRSRPNYANQTSSFNGRMRGGAWELAVQLANETDKDIWINVPHKATNDYITKLAQLVLYGSDGNNPYTSTQSNPVYAPLKSNLKVYVEWSNELWNFAPNFDQSTDNYNAAKAEVNAGGSPLNFGGETNDWVWAWRRVGKKAYEVSNIFRSVFGNSAMMSRVRPILAWQIGDGQGTGSAAIGMIEHLANGAQSVNYYIYGGGGSYYYSPNDDSNLTNLFNSMPAGWELTSYQTDQNICNQKGIKRIAYEAGPSLDRTHDSTRDAVRASSVNDARMKQEVIDQHNSWVNRGGDLVMYFTNVGDHQWGFTNDVLNDNTYKLQAIDALNSAGGGSSSTSAKAINAGGGATGSFSADAGYSGGNTYSVTNAITTSGVTNAAPAAVYQSERYGNVTYTISGLTANGAHTVRLHFCELYWTASGQRKFNVSINGGSVLSNFDIFADAGARFKAVVKSFTGNANSSGQITVTLTSVTDNASISGIEVIAGTNGGSTSGPIANGSYRIVARHSNKVLDVPNASTSDGIQLQQWAYFGNQNQKWQVTLESDGYYTIRSVGTNKVVDATNSSSANGTKVQQWTSTGSNAQRWKITDLGGGYYTIASKLDITKVLDVAGVSTSDGAKIQLWAWSNGTNQQWQFLAP
jgi:hypothetical protein